MEEEQHFLDLENGSNSENDIFSSSGERNLIIRTIGSHDSSGDVSRLEIEINSPGKEEIERSKVGFDYSSLKNSLLMRLGGRIEYILTFDILTYLSASDLLRLSRSCRFFQSVCKSNLLWIRVYQFDFLEDINQLSPPKRTSQPTTPSGRLLVSWGANRRQENQPISSSNDSTAITLQEHYKRRYEDYRSRISRSREDQQNLERDMLRLDRIKTIEVLFDTIQIRLFAPLILSCFLLSMILYVQKVDGLLAIPYWACAIPLVIAIIYLILCLLIVKCVYHRQYSTTSLFKGLWNYMRGPMVSLYQDLLSESKAQLNTVIGLLLLLILQIGMIVIKLTHAIPTSFRDRFVWGIVFIPIWILFGIYCLLPLSKFRIDVGVFWFGLNMIWVPLFIFFVCLTVKLDQNRNIRLALMMIPFYIIEGSVLLASLGICISGIYRYRRGLLERVDEHLAVFIVCWLSLSPVVAFQALLSARDDHQIQHPGNDSPTATEVVTPLIIIIGWFTLVLTVFSWNYRTAFQELRATTRHDSAGLRVIYPF